MWISSCLSYRGCESDFIGMDWASNIPLKICVITCTPTDERYKGNRNDYIESCSEDNCNNGDRLQNIVDRCCVWEDLYPETDLHVT